MDAQDIRNLQEAYMEVVDFQQLDEVSDRKVRAVRDAREKQWNKQFGKNRVQDPTDDMVDKVDKLIDQRNKRTGSKVKKTTMGQLRDKYRKERLGEQVDIYDIILSHLLDEGYAETPKAAEAIMVNMSEEWRESIMIAEGMTMKDFKANRQKSKRRAASADAVKRGHVGKEWYNSGRRYSPDEAKRMRSKLDDEERRTRHRSAVDPDNENDDNFSADKTKNPKKLRKQKAMGEM